ncbi:MULTISPECIES: cellulase family glycosylhydrolase [unclassified Mesorhizobium]|uniref:cellulase family glycosylhydrolase n=1 Tax=unclassified Mesorhizobium TaxID=325217 RepID=UPI000FD58797|nr:MULTISPECIES: cellulase family glycosylhydrolase [unclassified Mesorhizobium]RUU72484.1 hypothetical protein EOC06_37925 [Mesorhizobium sp. M7A.F.Ca.MR.362.00.0.0]RWN85771.1 MAG: hypothetical protein EOS05_36165 [Mesorhizobium sp.]RWO93737.1 MAG: hypothetical protein EOQ98_34150 [Mesorhizobium sp.]TIM52519.1 MAG: glycoside hydrolase family 5 protein [Mesorhizobium sp.]
MLTKGKDYTWPSTNTLSYFADKGFNTVRLPFKWERLQPKLMGELDEAELQRLMESVELIRARGMRTILDPLNYARYDEKIIGSKDVPIAGQPHTKGNRRGPAYAYNVKEMRVGAGRGALRTLSLTAPAKGTGARA